jgi:hypothetical protein
MRIKDHLALESLACYSGYRRNGDVTPTSLTGCFIDYLDTSGAERYGCALATCAKSTYYRIAHFQPFHPMAVGSDN